MQRLSLSNRFRKISHAKFIALAKDFKQACEGAFGTQCSVEISALSAPKAYTTFMDDRIQEVLDRANESNHLGKAGSIEDVTKEMYRAAKYIEMTVRPVNEDQAPDYAFGHVEFGGNRPRQATFYIQGGKDCAEACEYMVSRHENMKVGDGYDGNGTRSTSIPDNLKSALGL